MVDVEETDGELYPYPPVNAKDLGERIRFARKRAGYTSAGSFATALVERMGVTVGGHPIQAHSVTAIERGTQDPSHSFMVATVALTGVSFEWYEPSYRPDVAKAVEEAHRP